jgi:hypothetical protein
MRKQLFLFFIGVMVCTPLQGMEQCPVEVKKIILWHAGRRAQKMFAQVSKANNQFMEEHCRARKKIKELMAAEGTPIVDEKVRWNNEFSKCAWLQLEDGKKYKQSILKIVMLGLCEQMNLVMREGKWENGYEPLAGLEDLFFNKNGAACCYGRGYIPIFEFRNKCAYLEYSLNGDGLQERRECIVEIDDTSKMSCDLEQVHNIPAVMKAFLQSPYIYTTESGDIIKLYNLAKVIFPDEYKEKYANPQLWHDYTLWNSLHENDGAWDIYPY